MNAVAPSVRRLTGWHVLAIIVGFFLVVIAADTLFAILAYRSAPGETAKDPYEAGLAYQRTLDQKAREAALGWTARVVQQASGDVDLILVDRAGTPLSGLKVTGRLTRPATELGARDVTFIAATPGRYRLASSSSNGAWDLDIVALDATGGRLDISRRLQWP